MANIIIKDRPNRFGKTRSEHEKNLRSEGWTTLSDIQFDRCKYLEKKSGTNKSFFDQAQIGKIK